MYDRNMRCIVTMLMVAGLVLAVSGCGIKSLTVAISGDTAATPFGAAELKASVTDGDASITWSATGGSFDPGIGDSAVWIAPGDPGTYTISATAVQGSRRSTTTMKVVVKEPPLQVVDWLLKNDAIGGKDAQISSTNVGTKTIVAYRVRLAMWNSFGERVSYLLNDTFRGFAERNIEPGQTNTATWSLYWATGVSRIVAWVYEVAYEDGSTWSLY
jgi:hypothetical protein